MFASLIPYENGHLSPVMFAKMYPFWDTKTHTGTWRDNSVFSVFLGCICTVSLCMQLVFIIDDDSVYRWISLSFLCICILGHIFYFILNWFMNYDSRSASPSNSSRHYFWHKLMFQYLHIDTDHDLLIERFRPLFVTNICSIYPHIILLTIRILSDSHHSLSTISYLSYCISYLSIVAFYIVLCSLFLNQNMFMLNVLCCILDLNMTLFVLFSIFYDDTVTIVIIIDLSIFALFITVAAILGFISFMYVSYEQNDYQSHCCYVVSFIFWAICALFLGICALFLLPIVFTVIAFPICIIEQYLQWNIFPLCVKYFNDYGNHDLYWFRNILCEWIKNTSNEKEREHRLCCTNMMIIDTFKNDDIYSSLLGNTKLKVSFDNYLVHFNENSTEKITSNIPPNYKVQCPSDYKVENKWVTYMHYILCFGYLCTRFTHCVVCLFITMYIAFNYNAVTIIANGLFYCILVLFVLCSICFYSVFKSLHYHRAILPSFNNNHLVNNLKDNIAFCHSALVTLRVLSEIYNDDIARIIFEYIRNRRKVMTGKENMPKYKILILGASFSAKSTILKQLRHLYGRSFDEAELLAAKPHISQNVIEAIRTLAIYSDILADQGRNTRVSRQNREIRGRVVAMSDKQQFTKEHYLDFQKLWCDEGIRNVMKYKHKFQLIDTTPYFMDHMNDYWRDEYIPSFRDLIHSRQRTTGVNKIKFVTKSTSEFDGECDEIYEIFDVGGVKNERRKWVHFFDNISGIFFCAALSGYNQLLWEDNRNNRMREAIGLFRGIVNLQHFSDTVITVWFTKYDEFRKKIGIYSVKEHFKDFDGNETVEEIIEFFKQKFKDQRRVKPNRKIYFHVVSALDTSCIEETFITCRERIVDQMGFF